MLPLRPLTAVVTLCTALLTACPGPTPTPDTRLASIALTCTPGSVEVGSASACTAQGKNAAGTVLTAQPSFTFASSDTARASVTAGGTVTGVAPGSADITAKRGTITSNAVSITVKPDSALASIALLCEADNIAVGETTACTAVGRTAAGLDLSPQPTLTYASSAPEVASISASGAVAGVGAGHTVLTAGSGSVVSEGIGLTVTPAAQHGNVQVTVRDASTTTPLSGVAFNLCRAATSCTAIDGPEAPAGVYTLPVTAGAYAKLVMGRAGYRSGEYANLNVTGGQTTVLEQFLAIDSTVVGDGRVLGRMVDATTGGSLRGVSVSAYAGLNTTTGTPVASTVTDDSGKYALTVPTGYYTLVASLDQYVTSSFTVSVLGGREANLGDRALSPVLSGSGQWRFVLNWGAAPYDLDSHLTGPSADGTRFHVYFADRQHTDTLGSANLDVDDVSSYGPETITVTDVPEGLLRYSIHDYTNRSGSGSAALAGSGARVQVYRGSTQVAVFNVPSGAGDLWTVFTLDLTHPDSPVLTPVNSISTVGSSSSVQSIPGPNQPKPPINLP